MFKIYFVCLDNAGMSGCHWCSAAMGFPIGNAVCYIESKILFKMCKEEKVLIFFCLVNEVFIF